MFKERLKTHHSAINANNEYLIGMRLIETVLNTKKVNDRKNATIYIHVPFCNKICNFCNMRRSLQKPTSDYASLIVKEIEYYARLPYIQSTVFDAVYFGGGTPTMLSAEDLSDILRALKEKFTFTDDVEITIETTVTELTDEKIESLINNGVNRFSVGVQTFDEQGRMKMGRIGSGEKVYNKLKTLKTYDGVIVSMDLIYNYPEQTMESLYSDLNKIKELDLDGFSMYSLINMKGKDLIAQSEEMDKKMFFAIVEYMQEAGYHFLELTKMVKRDKYRYIMNRHSGADTLPLGAGAGGSLNNLMLMNPIELDKYKTSIEDFQTRKGMLFQSDYERITRFKGVIQMGMLPIGKEFESNEEYIRYTDRLAENGMVYRKGGKYYLTEKGIYWGNTISREISVFLRNSL